MTWAGRSGGPNEDSRILVVVCFFKIQVGIIWLCSCCENFI